MRLSIPPPRNDNFDKLPLLTLRDLKNLSCRVDNILKFP